MINPLNSNQVLAQSGVAFGTSGARGLVSQFTPDVCAAFTNAFTQVMSANYPLTQLALAIDNRPSSYAMAMACAQALAEQGVEAVFYGVLPTPALAYVAMEQNIPCIMVTGSHIPFDRNGLKFYRPGGEITKTDEHAILTADVDFKSLGELPRLESLVEAGKRYIKRYSSLFAGQWLAGKRIGVYEHSSSGRDLYADLFTELGAQVVSLERSDEFVPIDTEAVSEEDKAKAKAWSKEYGLDAIFSTDGDGDRPLVADEKGEWLRGDILGLLCAKELSIDALAVPVSCNTAIELSDEFTYVSRTRIGSPYVIAEFDSLANEYKNIAGFEANGGFLLGSDVEINGNTLAALPTRDALLPALMLLSLAKEKTISEIVEALPQRFTFSDRIKDFETARSQAIIAKGLEAPEQLLLSLGFEGISISNVDDTDGLRITLEDNRIVHLRPSGNAPELRCYAEADNTDAAKGIVVKALANVVNL
ncbi:phosphomannomutase [Psychrobium sp. 1_MG-2023]|uniref:phosphomannomutase n=1 Tax=Psychrobium sp. 1_MG-2023 TaxID=3062624 RepID=UPI000C31DBFF|nr:phosphomannomutase [Psychrobium sp. 1_MG-2023]MDP2562095.1 phosphomannomutase [Psychrobium sp. 1_MG-2023]PKF55694.1 phosphomannomutase [Alteromonadales bacterium alter-6D02]